MPAVKERKKLLTRLINAPAPRLLCVVGTQHGLIKLCEEEVI